MVASALFIMDLKGKIIISRNVRGDVPMAVSERCVRTYVCVRVVYVSVSATGLPLVGR